MNHLNRKEFVSVAAKTFLGVSAAPFLTQAQNMPTAKNVIYLYMNGGMTTRYFRSKTWSRNPR